MAQSLFIQSTVSHGIQFKSVTSNSECPPPKTDLPPSLLTGKAGLVATWWQVRQLKNRETKQASSSYPFKIYFEVSLTGYLIKEAAFKKVHHSGFSLKKNLLPSQFLTNLVHYL